VDRDFPLDAKRIFATGMSNGAFMAHRLACELSDRIVAIAPVAGVLGMSPCQPSHPVSVLEFHGTADSTVPYGGGGFAQVPGVEAVVDGWASREGCKGQRETVFHVGDVTCEQVTQCPSGVDVEMCRIDGGGHTWPGGSSEPGAGKTTQDVDATDYLWRFFKDHPRRP
jgi:polyhydroxybutyrate depolymerase